MIVSDICTRALGLAGVDGVGAAPSAENMDIAVKAYNLMLYAWALDGLDLGHVTDAIASDTVYIDPAYLKAVQYALAVELSLELGTELSTLVAQIAINEMSNVRAALSDVNLLTCDTAIVGRNLFTGSVW